MKLSMTLLCFKLLWSNGLWSRQKICNLFNINIQSWVWPNLGGLWFVLYLVVYLIKTSSSKLGSQLTTRSQVVGMMAVAVDHHFGKQTIEECMVNSIVNRSPLTLFTYTPQTTSDSISNSALYHPHVLRLISWFINVHEKTCKTNATQFPLTVNPLLCNFESWQPQHSTSHHPGYLTVVICFVYTFLAFTCLYLHWALSRLQQHVQCPHCPAHNCRLQHSEQFWRADGDSRHGSRRHRAQH